MRKSKILKLLIFTATVFGLGFLVWANEAQAANPPINGVLRVNPNNPRYFTNNYGKAIYLTGSHTWSNFQDLKRDPETLNFNWAEYLRFMEENNQNFIRLWVMPVEYDIDSNSSWSTPNMYERPGPDLAYDGRPQYDLSKFNPLYFKRLRERVEAANDKGIYVDIMFFNSVGSGYSGYVLVYPNKTEEYERIQPWCSHPYRGVGNDSFCRRVLGAGNNVNGINADLNNDGTGSELHTKLFPGTMRTNIRNFQEAYVNEVVQAVNDFDNVLYEIGNELVYESVDFQKEMIDYIHALESAMPKQHPVGMTMGGWKVNGTSGHITYSQLISSNAEWISPGDLSGNYATDPIKAQGDKVIILDTDHANAGLATRNHGWVWRSFMRGHNPIFMDIYQIRWLYYRDRPWNVLGGFGQADKVRRAMGDTKMYADKIDLVNMIPDDSTTSCSSTKYCLKRIGKEYLVYQSLSNSFTVNLAAGKYNYEWFNPDPSSGQPAGSSGTVDVLVGGNKTFTPVTTESILYLKIADTFALADVNSDGSVNIKDIQEVIRCIINSGSCNFTDRSDANGDGSVNIKDIQEVIRKIINPS